MDNKQVTIELVSGTHLVGRKVYQAGDRFQVSENTASRLGGKARIFVTGRAGDVEKKEEVSQSVQTELDADTEAAVETVPKKRKRRKKRNTK